MKLFRTNKHSDRASQSQNPQPAKQPKVARNPKPQWLKLAVQGGLLVIVFLVGALSQRAPVSLPANYGYCSPADEGVITPTLPSPTYVPAPTPARVVPAQALPTLYISIPPTYYEQIAAVRDKALKLGILLAQDNIAIPATLRYEDTDMPIEISLKGDWTDHLRGEKWSFRIKLEDNYRLFGMAVFGLQNPPVRRYTNEWGYMANLRRDGILGLRYQFVNVVLNGQAKGIYALEEGFSKELFEAQGRREGLILRYSEDLMWTFRSLYDNRYAPHGVDAFYIIDEYQGGRIASAPGLSNQRQAAIGMLRGVWTGHMRASDVFDPGLTGRFLALTNLWGGQHGLFWHNLRYFYNPLSTRIEPIGFNANALEKKNVEIAPEAFYHDPLLQAAYVKAALEVTSPGYLDQLEADLGPQFAELNQILSQEFGELPLPWGALRSRAEEIRQRIQPYQAVYAYLPLGTVGAVEVGNFLDWPVEVVALETRENLIPLERSWVVSESHRLLVPGTGALALLPLAPDAKDVAYARIQLPPDVISVTVSTPLTVVTRLLGATEADTQHQPAWERYLLPVEHSPRPAARLEQALAQHPFLEQDQEADWLLVRPGDWAVRGDLVLPQGYGLHIGPGTSLRFEEGAIMVVYGPVLLEGQPETPILLTTTEGGESWGGLIVMGEAGAPSALRYVTIEKTAGLGRPGWGTTAGTTFYKSPVQLAFCRLLHNQTEDAINFVHSPFEVLDTEFGYTYADALDSDFSTGLVERSAFHDIGNDGLDVSGATLTIRNVTMSDLGDKAVSVGENSRAEIDGLKITRASMGVAVKDGSHATVHNVTLSQVRVAGLAAYTKKTEYGPASMIASAIQFEDVARQALVQTGNWIDLDGERIWGVEVDVNKLYLPFEKER